MTVLTLAQVNNAIADTLGAATGLGANHWQSFDELTEGMAPPMLQVYWESDAVDATTATDRLTSRSATHAGVVVTDHVFHADLYGRQRSQLGEDMSVLYPLIDAVRAVLRAQTNEPFFGLVGIKSFKWSSQRVTFEYANVKYVGCRFTITIRIF